MGGKIPVAIGEVGVKGVRELRKIIGSKGLRRGWKKTWGPH